MVTHNWPTMLLLLSLGWYVSGCGTSEDIVVADVWSHPRFSKFHAAFPKGGLEIQFTGRRGRRNNGDYGQSYYTFSSHVDLAAGYELHVIGTAVAAPYGIRSPTHFMQARCPWGESVKLR